MTHDEHVEQAHTLIRSFVQLTLARLAQDWADRSLSLPQIRQKQYTQEKAEELTPSG